MSHVTEVSPAQGIFEDGVGPFVKPIWHGLLVVQAQILWVGKNVFFHSAFIINAFIGI